MHIQTRMQWGEVKLDNNEQITVL